VEELLLSAIECTGAGGVRQTEMLTAEQLVSEPSASEVEVAIGKSKGIIRRVFIRFQQN
jgi:hypothetical protein